MKRSKCPKHYQNNFNSARGKRGMTFIDYEFKYDSSSKQITKHEQLEFSFINREDESSFARGYRSFAGIFSDYDIGHLFHKKRNGGKQMELPYVL